MKPSQDEVNMMKQGFEHRGSKVGGYSFMDWLNTTAQLQEKFFGVDPFVIPDEDKPDFIHWNVTATVAEMMELLDEVGWKPWATSRHVNRDRVVGEAVDALHFIANILRCIGCGGRELTDAYVAKQTVNAQRQVDGYDGVSSKCFWCHTELSEVDLNAIIEAEEGIYCTAECHARNKFFNGARKGDLDA